MVRTCFSAAAKFLSVRGKWELSWRLSTRKVEWVRRRRQSI
jgi:hypothetical protein